jgi:hypothetical protein
VVQAGSPNSVRSDDDLTETAAITSTTTTNPSLYNVSGTDEPQEQGNESTAIKVGSSWQGEKLTCVDTSFKQLSLLSP